MYFFKVDISSFDDEAETVFIIPEQNADENGVPFEEKMITQTAEYKAFVKRTKTALIDCAYTQYQTEAVADGLNAEKFAQLEAEGKLTVIDANTYSISTGKSAKSKGEKNLTTYLTIGGIAVAAVILIAVSALSGGNKTDAPAETTEISATTETEETAVLTEETTTTETEIPPAESSEQGEADVPLSETSSAEPPAETAEIGYTNSGYSSSSISGESGVYTITFYPNGGEGTLESISAEAGQYVVLPSAESASKSISRKGYKLLGFSDNTDIAYPLYDYKMPYENVKLFAVWEPDTFTVNYNSNGGTGQLSRAEVRYSDSVPLPKDVSVYRDGLFLTGWAQTDSAKSALYASYHSIGEIIDEKQSIASANILGKIKAAISEIENKPQDEIPDDVDKFYVNPEMENVTWIRYNSDNDAGGQFVYTYMSFDDIFDAMEHNDPMEYLTANCGQEFLDRGAEGFDGVAEEFMSNSEDISSRDSSYMSKLFALTEPRYAIFQLKDDEKLRDYHFSNSKYLKNHGMYIDRENYNRVYRGRLQEKETLDDIYRRFNVDRPQDFYGHSLSVSDIVAVKKDGAITTHFVDSFGYTEVPDFTLSREERKTQRTLTDNIVLLAEKQLASDELDDLGNKLFDYDHAPVYSGITNWIMGASLDADEFEELTTRFHNGEDISAELAKKIYANMQYLNFEYPPTDGISRVEISSEKTDTGMTFRTNGGFEVSHTWEALGNALITAAKQEFDRHEQLDREYFLHEAKARINEYSQRECHEDARAVFPTAQREYLKP